MHNVCELAACNGEKFEDADGTFDLFDDAYFSIKEVNCMPLDTAEVESLFAHTSHQFTPAIIDECAADAASGRKSNAGESITSSDHCSSGTAHVAHGPPLPEVFFPGIVASDEESDASSVLSISNESGVDTSGSKT